MAMSRLAPQVNFTAHGPSGRLEPFNSIRSIDEVDRLDARGPALNAQFAQNEPHHCFATE